jgi:hypothetical protein
MTAARNERDAIRAKFRVEHDDGARCGIGLEPDGPRDKGGYPSGFHSWPIERRNAWFCGFNIGFCDRARLESEGTT